MSAWQPIETAPDDATLILSCDTRTGEIRVGIRKLFFAKSGKYEWFRSDEFCPGHTWSLTPTHWMPLPPPPSEVRAQRVETTPAGARIDTKESAGSTTQEEGK